MLESLLGRLPRRAATTRSGSSSSPPTTIWASLPAPTCARSWTTKARSGACSCSPTSMTS
jgi:hypothetical protein